MTEPISTSSATTVTTAVTLLALCPSVDAAVVIGAFAGAVIFVMVSNQLSWVKRAVFFTLSFANGCLTARSVAAAISGALPGQVTVSASVGALIAAAVSVKLLLWLIGSTDRFDSLLDRFKRKDKF